MQIIIPLAGKGIRFKEKYKVPKPLIDIFGKPMSGPLIIEEYDSTCLVLPGYSASVDENAIIDIRVEQ